MTTSSSPGTSPQPATNPHDAPGEQTPSSFTSTSPMPPGPPPSKPAKPAKQRNTVGLIDLITSIVGFIFACIPGALIVGWILLPVAFILAIVSLFAKGGKGAGITALILSILGTIVGVMVFFFAVGTAIDEAFGDTDVDVSSPAESALTEDDDDATEAIDDDDAEAGSDDDASATRDDEDEADASQGAADSSADVGTRENPAEIGSVITTEDWEVTVNSAELDATDEVLAANQFNESPEDGSQYLLVNLSATYLGEDSSLDGVVSVAYVTSSGEVIRAYEAMVVAPSPSFGANELYTGAESTGNIVLAVPQDDDGHLRVTPGILADNVFVSLD